MLKVLLCVCITKLIYDLCHLYQVPPLFDMFLIVLQEHEGFKILTAHVTDCWLMYDECLFILICSPTFTDLPLIAIYFLMDVFFLFYLQNTTLGIMNHVFSFLVTELHLN